MNPNRTFVIARSRRLRGNPGRFRKTLDCFAVLAMTSALMTNQTP